MSAARREDVAEAERTQPLSRCRFREFPGA